MLELALQELADIVKDLGFPIAVASYLLWRDTRWSKLLEQYFDTHLKMLVRIAERIDALEKNSRGTTTTHP